MNQEPRELTKEELQRIWLEAVTKERLEKVAPEGECPTCGTCPTCGQKRRHPQVTFQAGTPDPPNQV